MGNFLLRTDGYKLTHWLQYPPGTKRVYSYLESRGGVYPFTLFFGLQYILKKYLVGPVFNGSDVVEAAAVARKYFGAEHFNYIGWMKLLNKHEGKLPIRIRAIAEGTAVPTGNVLMTIENTDDEFPWLTNYVESTLLKVWYPTTVATQGAAIRHDLKRWLQKTGDVGLLDYKLHDFGYRGVSSEESSSIGGAAHLVNFNGTDTLSFAELLRDYYCVPMERLNEIAGSVPAAEHSTITSWGKEREDEAYLNMLNSYPEGLVSVVSDSWDVMNAVEKIWGGKLREHVLRRQGKLVIRPDSGDPPRTVLAIVGALAERFGAEANSKGYLVLNPKVGVLQGDGINRQSIGAICSTLASYGYSTDNINFGMGSANLQQVHRDTQKFAIKCSAVQDAEGNWQDVWKEAPGKDSKRGQLSLVHPGKEFVTFSHKPTSSGEVWTLYGDLLETVFENGYLRKLTDFWDIRDRARRQPVADILEESEK